MTDLILIAMCAVLLASSSWTLRRARRVNDEARVTLERVEAHLAVARELAEGSGAAQGVEECGYAAWRAARGIR